MTLATILMYAIWALKAVIFIDVILSWLMPPEKFPRSLTGQITDPLYAPIRAVLRPDRTGGIDFSPLIILMLIHFMENMLIQALHGSA
jgi:uncharacterized protein YggT (Ycf19 family)